MSQLQVTPQVLADTAGTLRAEQVSVGRTEVAIGAATRGIAAALPGSRTAVEVQSTCADLVAAARAAAAELAVLSMALDSAAGEYVAVEQDAAAGLERAGRRPS